MRNTHDLHPGLRPHRVMAVLVGMALLLTQCTDSFTGFSSESDSESKSNPAYHSPALTANSTLPGGALYEISLPPGGWSDLVIYAHGYVNPDEPLAIPDDDVDGTPISTIINSLGFAYATTSYRDNGLVIPDAVEDVKELLARFIELYGEPNLVYLVGPSEGGAVTTLAVEQNPGLFDAGFATCGPIGNFRKQLNYLGDFHVLFNYFFPGIDVGNPEGVPDEVINAWKAGTLQAEVSQALADRPGATEDLLNTAKVPADRSDPDAVIQAVLDVLRYNVLATNDAIAKLGGKPYGNKGKYYFGTGSFFGDWRLNRRVERFEADPLALQAIEESYQTSGRLSRPLVTMHTTGDNEVPYWHEPIYRTKTLFSGSTLKHLNIPILGRYGHCNFTIDEVLAGFSIMVYKATLHDLLVPSSLLPDEDGQRMLELSKVHGANPVVVPEPAFVP